VSKATGDSRSSRAEANGAATVPGSELGAHAAHRGEAVATIRQEQAQLLTALELLEARCRGSRDPRFAAEIEAVRRRLEQHIGLVGAVLEAAVEDDLAEEG
jgi:hypothetical protein